MSELSPPVLEQQPNLGVMDHMRNRWATLVAAGAATVAVLASPAFNEQPSYADTAQAVVGMPFKGKWAYNATVSPPYTDRNSSHPSVHSANGFDWSTDVYAAENTEVKVYGSSPQGTVTFRRNGTSDTCSDYGANIAGKGVTFDVLINGAEVGEVKYDHLDLEDVGSNPIASGTTIGEVTSEPLNSSCFQTRHAHIQLKNTVSNYSCYADHGSPGVEPSAGASLGVLGSTNTSAKQACGEIPATGNTSAATLARPAAISFNGALNVFTRGADGQIYTQYWNGNAWTGYSSIGGNMGSDPTVIENGGALNVFARGTDGQIYTKYNSGSGWSGWASMGSQTMKGNPTVMRYGTEINVFSLGADNRPYKNTFNGQSWGGWTSLGNYMDSSPAAVQHGSELDVIMRGGDNAVYKDTWNGSSWSGFGSLGGTVVGNPDVISYGGQLNIWTNTAGGHIFKRTWNGSGWGNWEDFGGTLHGNPDAMQYNSDMQIFARAANGVMHKRHWSASGNYWSNWESIDSDTPVAGDPTAIQYGTELDVFATGTDGKTYKNTFNPNSGWGGFTALPG